MANKTTANVNTITTATMKGEKTMTKNTNTNTTAQEVITVTLNANTEREGLEIRFSGYPKAVVKNELVALKFRYYPALGNAWIKKMAKVPEESIKKFVAICIKQGYEVKGTKDGKPDTWVNKYIKNVKINTKKTDAKETKKEEPKAVNENIVPVNTDAVLNAMIALLKENGYLVTKDEPKTEAKTEAKTEVKPKTEKKTRTKKTETKAKAEAPKEEPKPKAEEPKKLEAKAIPVSNNPKKTKADKKLYVDGKEIARLF